MPEKRISLASSEAIHKYRKTIGSEPSGRGHLTVNQDEDWFESNTTSQMIDVMRVCKTHGLTTFREIGHGSSKRSRCRLCRSEAVQNRRNKLKQLAVDYKGGKCERCGYDRCIQALEFHHIDPTEKDFGIAAGGNTRSWDKIKLELDKCLMLCANCHREEHVRLKIE